MDEKLIVDADGIPILTELVHENEIESPEVEDAEEVVESSAAIANRLLQSKSFNKKLEQLTATLNQQLIEQVEQSLQLAIEQAISLSLEDSSKLSSAAIQQQLENALPNLIAKALKK